MIAELPVHEPELTIGFSFPPQDQFVAINADHPLAGRQALDLEDLASVNLLHRLGDAPDYWKAARTPATTPAGTPISSSAGITSVGQGMSLVASGPHAMLVCRPLVEKHQRSDIRFVPVRGLEETSQIALVWRSDRTTPALRALASLLDRAARPEHAAVTPSSVPARIA
ncbi:LysR substrate-binding domain-containing protein [Microbacterium sp. BDGP8]|uniref:LysR substrate-binding domain-containing protein n=1 Tax=Microbacterium sp. BDGP8 TaxID=3035531 RepID=UPI00249E0A1C|nr:LysR substrate-binding domain-containing protein [Microbacterium sp. BDGP8]WHE35224.1 LysR substrate-binding domain-containing protein [Microbacterium sp. BDGP8]